MNPKPSPPKYKLTLGGIDRTANFQQIGWRISEQWSRQGNTMTVILIDDRQANSGNKATPNFVPKALQTIKLQDVTKPHSPITLFGGLTGVPTFSLNGPMQTVWSIDCTDWTTIANLSLVVGDWVGLTADQLVVAMVAAANDGDSGLLADYAPPLGHGFVYPGPALDRVQSNYLTLAAALSKVAMLSSTSTDYGWYIDENKKVHFLNETQTPGPSVTVSDTVGDFPSLTQAWYDRTMTYVWDSSSTETSCTVRGGTYSGNTTDTWGADGISLQWILKFPINTAGAAPTLTIGGVPTTVGLAGSGGTPDYVISQSAYGPFILQSTVGAPTAGQAIELTYPYQAPVIVRLDDATLQAQLSGLPNKGIFEFYVSDSTLLTLQTAQARASAELVQFSNIQERVTFTTAPGFNGHIRGGDLFTFQNSYIPDSQNSYNPGVNATFIALSVTITGIDAGYRTYNIQGARLGVSYGPFRNTRAMVLR